MPSGRWPPSSPSTARTASSRAAPPARESCSRSTSGAAWRVAYRAAVRGLLIVHCRRADRRVTRPPWPPTPPRSAPMAWRSSRRLTSPSIPDALTAHFTAAADACAPLPFFIYAFAARSGYPVPVEVVERVRASAANLAGLKVSESPLDKVLPYLDLGLPVLVGSEPLIPPAMARGAVGSVSGLASAFPDVVRGALDQPDDAAEARLTALRALMERQPFIAAAQARPSATRRRDQAGHAPPDAATHARRAVRRWMPPSMPRGRPSPASRSRRRRQRPPSGRRWRSPSPGAPAPWRRHSSRSGSAGRRRPAG